MRTWLFHLDLTWSLESSIQSFPIIRTWLFVLTWLVLKSKFILLVLPFHEDLTLSSWSPSSSIQSCLGMKTRLFHLDLTCHEVLANPSSLVLSWGPEVTEQSVMRLCCLICTKLVCHKISSEDNPLKIFSGVSYTPVHFLLVILWRSSLVSPPPVPPLLMILWGFSQVSPTPVPLLLMILWRSSLVSSPPVLLLFISI